MTKEDSSFFKIFKEYLILTLAAIPMIVGVYVFKFPRHFTFAGVTGISVILKEALINVFPQMTESNYNLIFNIILLLLAFILLGKNFGVKTVYVTLLSSLGMKAMEYIAPSLQTTPISDSMEVELFFAILLPAISTAILMNHGASAGGTEIVAMIFRKYTSWNISIALLAVDSVVTLCSYFLFGWTIGLASTVGLIAKSLVINNALASMNMAKMFTIICDNPDIALDYIENTLHTTATQYDAQGSYSHSHKTVLMSVLHPKEAKKLRAYMYENDPKAFMMVTSSSEIIGRGFHTFS